MQDFFIAAFNKSDVKTRVGLLYKFTCLPLKAHALFLKYPDSGRFGYLSGNSLIRLALYDCRILPERGKLYGGHISI